MKRKSKYENGKREGEKSEKAEKQKSRKAKKPESEKAGKRKSRKAKKPKSEKAESWAQLKEQHSERCEPHPKNKEKQTRQVMAKWQINFNGKRTEEVKIFYDRKIEEEKIKLNDLRSEMNQRSRKLKHKWIIDAHKGENTPS